MMEPKVEALRKLIAAEIAASPYELDGFKWCAMPQKDMAAKLGFSIATLNRLIRKPPFVRERTHHNGKPVTVVREGKPGPKTPRHVANIMSSIWRKKFDRYPSRPEYGCMFGLAENWPEGVQIEIFKLVISNEGWGEFMAGAWIEIEKLEGVKHYYKYPSLTVIRRFHTVAVELYNMHQQLKGGTPSISISKPKTLKLKPGPSPALEALKAMKSKI